MHKHCPMGTARGGCLYVVQHNASISAAHLWATRHLLMISVALYHQLMLLLGLVVLNAVHPYIASAAHAECRADVGAAVWPRRLVCAPHQSHWLQHCLCLPRSVACTLHCCQGRRACCYTGAVISPARCHMHCTGCQPTSHVIACTLNTLSVHKAVLIEHM